MYWTRTVRKEIWNKFYHVRSNGAVDFNFSNNYEMGLAPAFRIN